MRVPAQMPRLETEGCFCDVVTTIAEISIMIRMEITLRSVTDGNSQILAWMHVGGCQPSFTRNCRAEQTTMEARIDDFRRFGTVNTFLAGEEQIAIEKQDRWTRCAVDYSAQS